MRHLLTFIALFAIQASAAQNSLQVNDSSLVFVELNERYGLGVKSYVKYLTEDSSSVYHVGLFPTGNLAYEYYELNGEEIGTFRQWNKSGQIIRVAFSSGGVSIGTSIGWFDDGAIEEIAEYSLNAADEITIVSHDTLIFQDGDGVVRSQPVTGINKSNRQGHWKRWNENGEIIREELYNHGRKVNE
ncbi:MAG: hypothetical protein GC178_18715 [Flavobacteriales bacterium]|nr:hypothetical protein [Flavobacteriales bacterium]